MCFFKVNELMDTMTAERLALTERIVSLEVRNIPYIRDTLS